MNHIYRCVVATVVLLGICCAWAGATHCAHAVLAANTGEDSFEQLFGEQIKKVKSTRTSADDLALAKQMLETAAKVKADEPMLIPLLDYVYEHGRKTEPGYSLALEALKRLGEQFPAKAGEARDKTIALLKTAYLRSRSEARKKYGEQLIDIHDDAGQKAMNAGDYKTSLLAYREAVKVARSIKSASAKLMQQRTEQITEMLAAERRIAILEKKTTTTPVDPKVANELVTLCVAKLNSPKKATAYSLILDEAMRKRLELATKPADEVDAAGCTELGIWYSLLAKPEKKLIKLTLLEKAEGYLVRAQSLSAAGEGQPKSVAMLKLELTLKQVRAELEKLLKSSGSKGRWVDLTKQFAAIIASDKLDGRGTATFKDGVFQMEGDDPRLLVPVKSADVIISVEIIKTKGLFASIAGRVTETGSYWIRMAIYDVMLTHRWTKDGGGLELKRKSVKKAFTGKFVKIQFAILGDTLITFVEDKEVMRIKNTDVKDPGNVSIGARAATVRFKNPRYLIPSAKLTKQLLAGEGKP